MELEFKPQSDSKMSQRLSTLQFMETQKEEED